MQTVTLSEFCRIVKKVSKERKGKLSLGKIGENHGTCEETGKQHGRIPRYRGSGMYEKCGSELERPYLSPQGKREPYKRKRNRIFDRRESERNIVPRISVKQNAD